MSASRRAGAKRRGSQPVHGRARSAARAGGKRERHGPLVQLLDGIHGDSESPMYVRLYRHIRNAIVTGALPPGHRLPASRTLAADLRVSRNTVEAALGQLRAEGFIRRRVGAGSCVAPDLPRNPRTPKRLLGQRSAPGEGRAAGGPEALSARGRHAAARDELVPSNRGHTFAPCLPDLAELPVDAWKKILARRARRWSGPDMLPPDPAGYRPLREAIAAYLVSSRGVRCEWPQVLILGSVQQGIAMVGRLLLDPGDAVWMEEPGYPAARAALEESGARITPVPVDADGLNVALGASLAPAARLAYVTPSHQFPLGVTLGLARRMALLDWAAHHDAWILEDDYDSEFRYVGRPIASVQGLDRTGRVIYAGTLNKALFPSLRLAYLVLPPDLVHAFANGLMLWGTVPPTFLQAAAAEFIDGGHFSGYLRKVHEIYAERRSALLDAAREHLAGRVELGAADAGLHVAALFRPDRDDQVVSSRAAGLGLDLPPLSRYYADPPRERGVLIHYAAAAPRRIHDGIRRLAGLLDG